AMAAPLDLLDYVAIGGVYDTTSKENAAAPIGIGGFRTLVQAIPARKPKYSLFAIAGINFGKAAHVTSPCADGVAVISALSLAPDPARAAQNLLAVVDGALTRRGQA